MTTDIVECPHSPIFTEDEEYGKAGDLEGMVVAWFGEVGAMEDGKPCL